MFLNLLITMVFTAAQTDALYAGPVPAEVPTFEVTIGSSPSFYAALRIDGQWVREHSTEIKPNLVVDFVPDGPTYTGEPSRTLMRNAKVVYEPPAMRRKRLHEMWDTLGYTFLETPSGWRRIRKEDLHLAERARHLAQAVAQGQTPPPSSDVTQEQDSASTPAAPMPAVSAWAYRIGILLVAILLLSGIFYWGTRSGDAWQRLE